MKILIFKKNSPWGVIKDPKKGNIYHHVINFVDKNNIFRQHLKDEFVNDSFLEPGEKYNLELEQVEDHNFQPISESKFNFFVTPRQQNNKMTVRQIELSDFCCVKIDSKILFYTLKVIKSFHQKTYFEAELDIFFSYNITFRINTKNPIIRGFENRFKKLSGWISKYIINWNSLLKTENGLISEKVKEYSQNLNYENEKIIPSSVKSEISWLVVFATKSTVENEAKFTSYFELTKNIKYVLPYKIHLYPFIWGSDIEFQVFYGGNTHQLSKMPLDIMTKEGDKVVNSYILNFFPFEQNDYVVEDTPDPKIKIIRFINTDNIKLWEETKTKEYLIIASQTNRVYNKLIARNHLQHSPIPPPSVIAHNQVRNMKLEPKLWTPQFYKLGIRTWKMGDETDYFLPFVKNWSLYKTQPFDANEIVSYIYHSFDPYIQKTYYWIEQENNDVIINKKLTIDQSKNELPQGLNDFAKYIRENKNKLEVARQFDTLRLILSAATLAGSAIGGIMTGNPAAALGLIGGTGSVLSSVNSMQQREAMLDDIINKPATVEQGSTCFFDSSLKEKSETHLVEKTLLKPHLEMVYSFLQQFGYTINEIKPLNNYVNNRYHYNYIQALDVFNVIENKFSAHIKQIISDAFAEGITIWHYRDKTVWKGILNYEYENWEIDFLK